MKQLYTHCKALNNRVLQKLNSKLLVGLLFIFIGALNVDVKAQGPVILSHYPSNGAIDVPTSFDLTVTFSEGIYQGSKKRCYFSIYKEGMDPDSDDAVFEIKGNSSLIINGSTSLTIPVSGLDNGESYFIVIDKGFVKNSAGVDFAGISSPTDWTFTTASAPVIPLELDLSQSAPLKHSTNVSLTPTLSLTFNKEIVKPSGDVFLRLRERNDNPDGDYGREAAKFNIKDFDFSNGNQTISIDFSKSVFTEGYSPLKPGTEYYVTIEPGFVLSANGGQTLTGFGGRSDWHFTTGGVPFEVTSRTPSPGAQNVVLSPTIEIEFSEDIQKGMSKYLRIRKSDGTLVKEYNVELPDVVVSDNKVTIPVSNLEEITNYYITIDEGFVKSQSGVDFEGISNVTAWTFTTGEAPHLADENALFPEHEAINIPVDTEITITFKDDIQFNTSSEPKVIEITGGANVISFTSSASGVSSGLSINGNVLTIKPGSALEYGILYKVKVYSGAIESLAGIPFAGIGTNGSTWQFETVPPPSPVGTLKTPAEDATHISILTDVVIDYDMAIHLKEDDAVTVIDNNNVKSIVTINHNIVNGGNGDVLDPIHYEVTISADKKKLTIKLLPSGFYYPGAGVNVTIAKVCNHKGIEQYESQIFSFTTGNYNIWEGTENSNWSNIANWKYGKYEEGNSFIINPEGNPAILDKDITMPNLIISKGAKLTINTGVSLTVQKDFKLYSGNSGAGASLLINGTLTSNAAKTVVYQDISSFSNSYYFSTPVQNTTKQVALNNGDIVEYNTVTDGYDFLNASSVLVPGKGYIGRAPAGSVFSFVGNINQEDQYFLSADRNSKNFGWFLAGNPYTCAVNLASVYPGGFSDLKPHFYIRDNSTFQLHAWNFEANTGTTDGAYIPSMHSFWLQVDVEKEIGSFTVTKANRVHNTNTYHKSSTIPNPTVKFYVDNGFVKDMSVVTFIDGISDIMDKYDSEKRFAKNTAVAESYTVKDGSRLIINSYGSYDGNKDIPVGVYAEKAGEYTFGLSSVVGFEGDVEIKLLDYSVTPAIVHNLSDGDYTFTTHKGYSDSRFVLQINDSRISTGVDSDEVSNDITIYSFRSDVVIENKGSETARYSLHDTSGRLLYTGDVYGFSRITVPVSTSGIVIGTVKTSKEIVNKKLLIQ